METKHDVCNSSKLIKRLGFPYVDGVDSISLGGGLWIGWNKAIKFNILKKEINLIHGRVTDELHNSWLLSRVYAPPVIRACKNPYVESAIWA